MTWVYVLKLSAGNYYVGTTDKSVEERHQEHCAGHGAAWTQKFPPVTVVDRYECRTKDEAMTKEMKVSAQLALIHGWEKVRGATFCQLNPSEEDVQGLVKNAAH